MNMFDKVADAVNSIPDGWTSVPKAQIMAAAVLALRPQITVEIGVFAGKGVAALGMAHKEIGYGICYGVDPFSKDASAEGQVGQHLTWWNSLDHEAIYQTAKNNVERLGLVNYVRLIRQKSQEWMPPEGIGLLRIDGNHSEVAIGDVERYAPKCHPGAFLFLDDLHSNWPGGAINKCAEKLKHMGWAMLYNLDDGIVLQKR